MNDGAVRGGVVFSNEITGASSATFDSLPVRPVYSEPSSATESPKRPKLESKIDLYTKLFGHAPTGTSD